MKHTLILIILFAASTCAAQDSINPYNIQQKGTLELHGSRNVYYNPFAPPGKFDTPLNLCNESDQLRDSNAIGNAYRLYLPFVYDTSIVYGTSTHQYDFLSNWAPYGTPLGPYATWQRLFQSLHGDIIAGGLPGDTIVVSANEDVDFRASGTIKLEDGFHVMPGAYFHAYQEPQWDTAVFSDEFDDTAKFQNQWHVNKGWGDGYGQGADCSSDSNVRLVTDTDAHDGHALDIILREVPDTCSCFVLGSIDTDNCESIVPIDSSKTKFIFSTAILRSCPFPDSQHVSFPFASQYAHAPYGKYEIREKIPHVKHHTNNWGGGNGFEWDMNETDNGYMNTLSPNFNHDFHYGPLKGVFSQMPDSTVIFVSSGPEWCPSNNPASILIDNVPYIVHHDSRYGWDTIFGDVDYNQPAWPTSLSSRRDSITFYYTVHGNCNSDMLTWQVKQDDSGRWRKFYAWYHVNRAGATLRFSKWNQPSAITLTIDTALGRHVKKTIPCHWEYTLNSPIDSGILFLDTVANDTDSVQTITSTDLHSNTESFQFNRRVLYAAHEMYPEATLPFDGEDMSSGYEYHTFTMEWLPHEIRYLYDSMVLRRFPDRLIPTSSPYYDWITTMPRSLANIRPAEVDMDYDSNDPFGTDSTYVNGYQDITYVERHYFETHLGNPGFWDVEIPPESGHWYHAAHHLIDYINVFDVPKDVTIPDYPK